MGTVYAVRDPQRPNEPLALKVLRADMAASAELREWFAREAKTVGGLYKRGIVWAIEADAHGSPAWLLMERVAGLPLPDGRRALSLAELRKAYGDALPERAIARLLDLCLDGLYAAHATGVVHRDLKPGNILLDPGGETNPGKALEKAEPKIADFGLVALRAAENDVAPTATMPPPLTVRGGRDGQDGALLGTWDFMAPEQKQGKPADKRSDTYAMTLIAFWLLTGNGLGVNKASEMRPSLAPAWEAFLERGYAPDPAARYQDAAEMRRALHPVIRALAATGMKARKGATEGGRRRGVGYCVLGAAMVLASAYWFYAHRTAWPHLLVTPPAVVAAAPVSRTNAPLADTTAGLPLSAVVAVPPTSLQPGVPLPVPADVQDLFTPAFAALPPDERCARVLARLKQMNPSMTGNIGCQKEQSEVTEIDLPGMGLATLWPLRALPHLKVLKFREPKQRSSVSDLSPLRGMQLVDLDCGRSEVTNLAPLAGMPLKQLVLFTLRVSDLSPLRGMQLNTLRCGMTKVRDLSPLHGMPMEHLQINSTQVADLAPVAGMPLIDLNCESSPIVDFSPLKEVTTLRDLVCDFKAERDAAVLRSITTLQRINNMPAAEFWQRVDAGESPRWNDAQRRRRQK